MPAGIRFNAWRKGVQFCNSLPETESVIVSNFHWLHLLKAGLLCNLVLTLIGIMLKVSHVSNVTHISHLVSKLVEKPY